MPVNGLLHKIRADHPKLGIIITGDGLYANLPFLHELKCFDMSYILVVKSGDHKFLFNRLSALKEQNRINKIESFDVKGRRHIYEWVNGLPLNGSQNTDYVNFFEYTIITNGKKTFHCSWVTDIFVDQTNIETLVKGGRARWKIENENFNTLKNQGYHAEHNFGHGNAHASLNFFLFILVAFFVHQILELTDPLFQKAGKNSAPERSTGINYVVPSGYLSLPVGNICWNLSFPLRKTKNHPLEYFEF